MEQPPSQDDGSHNGGDGEDDFFDGLAVCGETCMDLHWIQDEYEFTCELRQLAVLYGGIYRQALGANFP